MTNHAPFPLHYGDFTKDTTHLGSAAGPYLLILLRYWNDTEPPPNDEEWLANVTGMRLDHWRRIAPKVLAMFELRDGRLYKRRVEHELAKLQARRERAAAARSAKAAIQAGRRRRRPYPAGVESTVRGDTPPEKPAISRAAAETSGGHRPLNQESPLTPHQHSPSGGAGAPSEPAPEPGQDAGRGLSRRVPGPGASGQSGSSEPERNAGQGLSRGVPGDGVGERNGSTEPDPWRPPGTSAAVVALIPPAMPPAPSLPKPADGPPVRATGFQSLDQALERLMVSAGGRARPP